MPILPSYGTHTVSYGYNKLSVTYSGMVAAYLSELIARRYNRMVFQVFNGLWTMDSDGMRPHFGQCHAPPMLFSLISFKHFIWYHFEHMQHLIVLFVFETLQIVVQNFTLLFFHPFFDFLSMTDVSVSSVAGASDCCVRSLVTPALSVATGCEPVLLDLCAADMAAEALARIESLAVATAAVMLSQSTHGNLSLTHMSPFRVRCSHGLSSIWLAQCSVS